MPTALTNIADALRTEDIEGLIASGAPSDEYNSEAEKIASALASLPSNQLTEARFIEVITLVWAKSFNLSAQEVEQRIPAFKHISSKIL